MAQNLLLNSNFSPRETEEAQGILKKHKTDVLKTDWAQGFGTKWSYAL